MPEVIADLSRDSLFEIQQLLKQKAPCLREAAESTQSLRRSYPFIDVAESIYNEADRVSMHSDSSPMIASSQLDFDFDDIVVDSAAYRRVIKRHAAILRQDKAYGDLIRGRRRIITDTYSDSSSAGEKDGNDGRDHERQKRQTEHHALDLQPDKASKHGVEGKEGNAISTRHGVISKKEDYDHKRQKQQPNMLPLEDMYQIPSKFKPDIPAPWRSRTTLPDSDIQVPLRITPIPRNDDCPTPKQEQEDETHDDLIDFFDDATIRQEAEEYSVVSLNEASIVKEVHSKDISQSLSSTTGSGSRGVPLILFSSCPRVDEKVRALTEHEVVHRHQNDYPQPLTCNICLKVFGPNDTCYRHAEELLCFRHYTTNSATSCQGCDLPILSTRSYIDHGSQQNPWHRDCFKAYSYWDVKFKPNVAIKRLGGGWYDLDNLELHDKEFKLRHDGIVATISAMFETTSTFQTDFEMLASKIPVLLSGSHRKYAALYTSLLLSAMGVLFTAFDSAQNQSLALIG